MKQEEKQSESTVNVMKNIPLYEKYRPQSLDEVLGQDKSVKRIREILSQNPTGRAWWIAGASGVGKTTLARIIAKHGPRNVTTKEFDSANEVTAKVIQNMQSLLSYKNQIVWYKFIINEAHGLNKRTMRSLLGILEKLNNNTVIFTTTKTAEEEMLEGKIDATPLLSRCFKISLTNQGLAECFAKRCQEIAKIEKVDGGKPLKNYINLAQKCKNNFRAMLMEIEARCMLD